MTIYKNNILDFNKDRKPAFDLGKQEDTDINEERGIIIEFPPVSPFVRGVDN